MTIVCNTPSSINRFRFVSLRGMLKLEKSGLKHSGGALRPRLAKEFGLKPRASHDEYIAYCDKQIAESDVGVVVA